MPMLEIERAEGYALLTLNRPEAKNALSRPLRAALARAVQALKADPTIQVLIVTGAGNVFCAGLDLKEVGASADDLAEALRDASPVDALRAFNGPVIGAINGPAITGGFELALGCDLLIASTQARFADTHGLVGLLPIWGLSQRLGRAIGVARAKELSLTGNFLDAQTAYDWGLVNRVVAPEQLLPAARALACEMLALAPGLLSAYRRLIDDGAGASFTQALAIEQAQAQALNRGVDCESIEARRLAIVARGRKKAAVSR